MGIKVFWIEPTDRERRWLRRFSFSSKTACPKNPSGCDAMFPVDDADILYTADGNIDGRSKGPPRDDPRWPRVCASCGRPFNENDEWQLHGQQIYIRPDTRERYTLRDAPIGACWDAWWIHARNSRQGRIPLVPGVGSMLGDDGRSLIVKCPDGHDWMIDARARNCTMPTDNTHHCWVRHGRPEDGNLHVDKSGVTCGAGAGSIDTGKYHGFLHNGEFT